jgi:hypothetical protein
MWLLDVNLPSVLQGVLCSYGIDCDTAVARGWRALTNGTLAETAYREGFRVILTRDRGFGDSAASPRALLSDLAIVIVTLPQARGAVYVAEFKSQWALRSIEPQAGRVVVWPRGA